MAVEVFQKLIIVNQNRVRVLQNSFMYFLKNNFLFIFNPKSYKLNILSSKEHEEVAN